MKTNRIIALALLGLSTLNVQLATLRAQGTAFTYQGRLNANGAPANGIYDFDFALFNASSGGSLIGSADFALGVPVTNGLFTVSLDFGANFPGAARWLEIAVRTNGTTIFNVLSPRQLLTPTPYAISAANVANGAVDTAQLAGGAVTSAKIADSAVDTAQLASGAVTSAKVADGTLLPADLNLGNFDRAFWKVGGNTGTSADFIGTRDDQPFDVRVNNVRVMRYRLNTDPSGSVTNAPNVIGGSSINGTVTTSVVGATIAGGGGSFTNDSFVGGYLESPNRVTANFGTVSGGDGNTASGEDATVGGGSQNIASGTFSMVPGGFENTAGGRYSFAAGSFATASHLGSFVWSDSNDVTSSAAANSVTMRASGGFRFFTASGSVGARLQAGDTSWSTICDRNEKKNFQPVNGGRVLEKLAALPVQSWNYKWEADTNTPHLGPMAQDFKMAFYPGRDDKSISTLEFDGVELAAIQGLNQKLSDQEARLKKKDSEIQELRQAVAELQKTVRQITHKTQD
jgi:Chaperone of endosialidase